MKKYAMVLLFILLAFLCVPVCAETVYDDTNTEVLPEEYKTIKGKLSLGEGGYVTEGEIYGNIIVDFTGGNVAQYVKFNDSLSADYELKVPTSVQEVSVRVYLSCSLFTETNVMLHEYYYYVGEDEFLVDKKSSVPYVIENDINTFDIVLAVAYEIKVNLKLPDDAVGSVQEAAVSCYNEKGGFVFGDTYTVTDNTFTVLFPPKKVSCKISLRPDMSNVSNILRKGYYYISDSESTTNEDDAIYVLIDKSMNLTIVLETGKIVQGTIVMPDDVETMKDDCVDLRVNGNGPRIYLTGKETAFGFGVSRDTDSIYLSYNYVGDNDELYKGILDYSFEGPVLTYNDADCLVLDENGVDGIVLLVAKVGKEITITAKRPDYAQTDYELRPLVDIELDNGETFMGIANISKGSTSTTTKVKLPDIEAMDEFESFKVHTFMQDIYNPDGLIYDYSVLYVNGDNTVTFDPDEADSYSIADTEEITFTVWDNSVTDPLIWDAVDVDVDLLYINLSENKVQVGLSVNNKGTEPVTVKLIVAEYNTEGMLVGVAYKEQTLGAYGIYGTGTDVPLKNPVNKENTYKLFVWDGFEGITPATKVAEITDIQ